MDDFGCNLCGDTGWITVEDWLSSEAYTMPCPAGCPVPNEVPT